jgi:hypothetical protein
MTLFDLALVPAASWPWGPPGAQLFDVLAVYGLLALLIGLVVWNAGSSPKIADGNASASAPPGQPPGLRTGEVDPGNAPGSAAEEPPLVAKSSTPAHQEGSAVN